MTALLTIDGVRKAYPGVVANDDVTFTVDEGEIHALLGENGAGKSTLVKMIFGLVRPDAGTMTFSSKRYEPRTPSEARASGVAMVFQHFSLFEALSVAENVALGMETPPSMRQLAQRIVSASDAYGLPLDPDRIVGDLSAGERQRVEIIRCLLQNPRLLIMDEPTSVLTPQEVEILFSTLRLLRKEGTSILYISHKLEEIRALCDRATVLRQGKVVGACAPHDRTAGELAEMMVGTRLSEPQSRATPRGGVALEVASLSLPSTRPFGTSLKDISFTVRRGDVLGIGGVAGNGQDELLGVLSGEIRTTAESVRLIDRPVGALGPNARRALGLLAAPEERLGHAAAPTMSLTENAVLSASTRLAMTRNGFVDWDKAQGFAREVIRTFDVRTTGPGRRRGRCPGATCKSSSWAGRSCKSPTFWW